MRRASRSPRPKWPPLTYTATPSIRNGTTPSNHGHQPDPVIPAPALTPEAILLVAVHHRLWFLAFPMRAGSTVSCRPRDLPVPVQGASAHARALDLAGPSEGSR